jgi:hypothetical protein
MDNTIHRFSLLLRFSGVFNIVSAFMLIFPIAYEAYLKFFNYLNLALNLGGKPVTIPENPLHALFINTAGIDLVLIGVIVLVVSKNPLKNRKIILFNGLGRILFAFVILYYVLVADVIRIIMVFGVIDVFISIGFLIYLYKLKDFGSEDSPKTKIS